MIWPRVNRVIVSIWISIGPGLPLHLVARGRQHRGVVAQRFSETRRHSRFREPAGRGQDRVLAEHVDRRRHRGSAP